MSLHFGVWHSAGDPNLSCSTVTVSISARSLGLTDQQGQESKPARIESPGKPADKHAGQRHLSMIGMCEQLEEGARLPAELTSALAGFSFHQRLITVPSHYSSTKADGAFLAALKLIYHCNKRHPSRPIEN